MVRKWYYTLALMVIYIAVFHVFRNCSSHQQVILAGSIATALLTIILLIDRAYFVNGVDIFLHATVIADVLIEAIWIYPHDNFMFYGCAAAFALVIIPYRLYIYKKQQRH